MRVNVYADELLEHRCIERVETTTPSGRKFYGLRVYLASPKELHDRPGDDDRTAVTFWGPMDKLSAMFNAASIACISDHPGIPTSLEVSRAIGCLAVASRGSPDEEHALRAIKAKTLEEADARGQLAEYVAHALLHLAARSAEPTEPESKFN